MMPTAEMMILRCAYVKMITPTSERPSKLWSTISRSPKSLCDRCPACMKSTMRASVQEEQTSSGIFRGQVCCSASQANMTGVDATPIIPCCESLNRRISVASDLAPMRACSLRVTSAWKIAHSYRRPSAAMVRQNALLDMWWRAACKWSVSKRICRNSEKMRIV